MHCLEELSAWGALGPLSRGTCWYQTLFSEVALDKKDGSLMIFKLCVIVSKGEGKREMEENILR